MNVVERRQQDGERDGPSPIHSPVQAGDQGAQNIWTVPDNDIFDFMVVQK